MLALRLVCIEDLRSKIGNAVRRIVGAPTLEDRSAPDETRHTTSAMFGGPLIRVRIVAATSRRRARHRVLRFFPEERDVGAFFRHLALRHEGVGIFQSDAQAEAFE